MRAKKIQSQINKSMQTSNLKEPILIKSEIAQPQQNTFWNKIKSKIINTNPPINRIIQLNGMVSPHIKVKNIVSNTKYNIITFVPLVLYTQFKFFINMFFLVTALTQLIPQLQVGLLITYLGPLILVLTLTMAKEAVDDFKRYRRDMEANSKIYKVLRPGGFIDVKSKQLNIGDIIEINGGDRIPADMLLLYSDDDQGTIFLKTDQLDGETDWKLRKSIKITQNLIRNSNDQFVQGILLMQKFNCEVRPPSDQIYLFEGIFQEKSEFGNQGVKQKLTLENTLWTSTVVANGRALGLIIYTGKQTRVALGANQPRPKVGLLDWQINTLSKILFAFLFFLTVIQVFLQAPDWKYAPITFTRILILLSSIIPISMRVNLDFAKLVYSAKINKDEQIKGTIARNSNIPEELGRIKYLLTDKTGTLTQNQMIFKKLSIQQDYQFSNQQINQLSNIVKEFVKTPLIQTKKKKKQIIVKELIYSLALCHNVTPVIEGQNRVYQASSPDQITLVKMAESMGVKVMQRTQNKMKIQNPDGEIQSYEIIYNFPFSSERKRMGILLFREQTKKYIFYLKGADAVMKKFFNDAQKKGFVDQKCKDLASIGLRTLVISQKILSAQYVQQWKKKYQEANLKLQGGKFLLEKYVLELESGMQFLGITGVEDKLQQSIKSTLQHLRNAHIKIWMLTGDKVQTAECISISSGITKPNQQNFKIEDIQTVLALKNKFESLKSPYNKDKILVIDGKSLATALDTDQEVKKQFYQIAMKLPSVLCCRCSPSQKAQIVAGIKQFNKNQKDRIAAIGDGGNDVGMIQAADIGLGIVGKQGKQAALAADYSLQKFKYIKKLLLWHGRLSYKRSALLAQFVIHRGLLISIMQISFSCIFYFVSIPIFNSVLNLGYATLFTFWPVFSLIFDQDIDKKNALRYPELYASLQKGNQLNIFTFLIWVWKAVYQGGIILILSIAFFNQSYLQLQTICFTILIITQYCMSLSQLHRLHVVSIICVISSLIVYILCIAFLRKVIVVSILSIKDIGFIFAIVAISWGPILVQRIIRKKLFPTDYQKVMINTNKKFILRNIIRQSVSSAIEDSEEDIKS